MKNFTIPIKPIKKPGFNYKKMPQIATNHLGHVQKELFYSLPISLISRFVFFGSGPYSLDPYSPSVKVSTKL